MADQLSLSATLLSYIRDYSLREDDVLRERGRSETGADHGAPGGVRPGGHRRVTNDFGAVTTSVVTAPKYVSVRPLCAGRA
jgi:hypothetical protein